MKVVHLSTNDGGGGAALAALRLHQGLRRQGVDSHMVVGSKTSEDPFVVAGMSPRANRFYRRVDRQACRLLRSTNPSLISPAWVGSGGLEAVEAQHPDLVHLHWVCSGFLRIEALRDFRAPLVWSLHDMWAFSGGEHYAGDSLRYRDGYHPGNRASGESGLDLNRWVWRRKQRVLRDVPAITFLCVSEWLAKCARASVLLRDRDIRVLHNGVDLALFRPQPRAVARQAVGLPLAPRLVLFGAVNSTRDTRKGFDLLLAALQHLLGAGEMLELVVFGDSPGERDRWPQLGFPVHSLGEIEDAARLAAVYAACDVMVVPSREEAFGQTAAEAMACGTPVVAFRVGGLPEIVTHKVSGYLAALGQTEELAQGLHWALGLEGTEQGKDVASACRLAVEQGFSQERQAEACGAIYREILATARKRSALPASQSAVAPSRVTGAVGVGGKLGDYPR